MGVGVFDDVAPGVNVVAVHIGCSGWSYAHWTGVLYPDGLRPRERLDYYLPHFRYTPGCIPRRTYGGGRRGSAEWERGGDDVYAYFNNGGEGNAVRNAARLRAFTEQ